MPGQQDLLRSYEKSGRIRRRATADHAEGAPASHPLVSLQRQVGNAQIARMLAQREEEPDEEKITAMRDPALQREGEEEEVTPQREADDEMSLQREGDEEEMNLQRQGDEEEEMNLQRVVAVQRQGDDEEEMSLARDPAVQRQAGEAAPEVGLAGGEISEGLTSRIQAARGGGSSMDAARQTQMESAFGTSFADVRIHTGDESDSLNRGVGAKAFTVGSDVFFGKSASPTDDKLLSHELTHVVQQRGGGGGVQASRSLNVTAADDASEAEADRMATAVVSGKKTAPVARVTDEHGR